MTPEAPARLAELRSRITRDLNGDAFFFPHFDGVHGWEGMAPVFFVTLNPSTAPGFPTKADLLLYRHMKASGFADAHLTDVLKHRSTGKMVPALLQNAALVDQNRAWLLEEVDIIRPGSVVALGRVAEGLLRDWLPNIRMAYVPHYSWAWRWPGKEARFAEAMASIRA